MTARIKIKVPNYRRATGEPVRPPLKLRRWMGLSLFLLGIGGALAAIAGSYTLAVVQTLLAYAIFPVCILGSATILGWALTAPAQRAGAFQESPWPEGYRLIVAGALGLGALALGTLLLGSVHLLGHGIPLVLPIVAASIGFYPVLQSCRRFDRTWLLRPDAPLPFLLAACVPLALLIIATTFPVGFIWNTEGRGYDVLLYHLQLPREYLEANSTAPLAHNVYSFLPSNMEMLYTLLMSLVQVGLGLKSQLLAIYPAQMLHALVTVLAAGAVALAPVRCSAVARGIAFTLVLGTPWTLVVGSLAYNDGAVLLYGALAIGLALAPFSWRTAALLGILLGLAVGCKMTAGVMVALPVAVLLLAQRRWRGLLLVAALATLVYLPWALRAAVYTHVDGQVGNPVFPIAAHTLGRGAWTPEQVDRFDRGHAALGERRMLPDGSTERLPITLGGRLAALVHETLRDPQWSPGVARMADWTLQPGEPAAPAPAWANLGLIWLAVPLVLVLAATRGLNAWKLLLVLAVQLAAWLLCTHLQARFLLPAIIPMALLFGLAAEAFLVSRAIIIGFVGLNAALCAFLLIPEVRLFAGGPPGLPIGAFFSLPQGWSQFERPFSDRTLERMKTCLVGPPMATPFYLQGGYVYNTVWDRNPLADALRQSPAAALAWLRANHCTFVAIDWNEVERLRSTYGFDPILTHENIRALRDAGLVPANTTYGIRPEIEFYEVKPAP